MRIYFARLCLCVCVRVFQCLNNHLNDAYKFYYSIYAIISTIQQFTDRQTNTHTCTHSLAHPKVSVFVCGSDIPKKDIIHFRNFFCFAFDFILNFDFAHQMTAIHTTPNEREMNVYYRITKTKFIYYNSYMCGFLLSA